mmetsp:Transcript_183752/g.582923  ORF Transcript_183752/g.582923 Transcript_183752/m.582923 type:complete len:184 (+) Transcript_183752:1294-1845(+)
MVPDVLCEYRILCFHDAAAASSGQGDFFAQEKLWLKMKPQGEHHNHQIACEVGEFAMASAHVISRDRASHDVFGGDHAARDHVENLASCLANKWFLWFKAECGDAPPATRLDFLVARAGGVGGGEPADYSVWTCEVGELGASLCSVECDARNCAALNWAVRKDPSGRFPLAMPAIARNNGWKS